MMKSKYIKPEYEFQMGGDKAIVTIDREDGQYNHELTIMFVVNNSDLIFKMGVEQNNKTSFSYSTENELEKMQNGLLDDIKKKFKERNR